MDINQYSKYTSSDFLCNPSVKPSHQYGEKSTTFLSLVSLKIFQSADFCLANNLAETIPLDDAILWTRAEDRNVAHFFLFEDAESCKPLTGEELSDSAAVLSLRQLYNKFKCVKQIIDENTPANYFPTQTYKLIIFTSRPVFKGPMFALEDQQLFSTKSGEVYSLNSELFRDGGEVEFCNFLDCVSLYANQGSVSNLEAEIRSCMQEILQGPITEAAMNNYMNYTSNWMQISTKKIGLNYSVIMNILEFSVLQSCSLPIEISRNNHEIHCSLWEDIKNKSIFIANSHLPYVTKMISNEVCNFNAQGLDLSFIANIIFNNHTTTTNQKYLLSCFLGCSPFVIEQCLFAKKFHCKYVPIGSEADSPKNLSQISNNNISQLLEQRIALNCGRNIALGKLLNDSFDNLLLKLSVSDVLALINSKCEEYIKTDVLLERKFKAILLQIDVLNQASDDLFVIKLLNCSKQEAIALMKIIEEKVCEVQNYESKFKYVFLREDEDFNNFTKLDSRNVHFVGFINEKENCLKWFATSGDVKNIKNFASYDLNKQDKNLINLNEFHNYFRQSFLIITGETGMGKTTALKQIGLNAPQNAWVLYVDLKREEDYFKFLSENSKFSVNSVTSLNNFYKSNGTILDEIFNLKLKSRQMLILLDGFDQIAPKFKKVATKIIKCIRADGFNTILTSKTSHQNSIENVFATFSIPLCAFGENDQEEYLRAFFGMNNNEFCNANVKSIIQQHFDGEFCSTPLNIKIIANILLKTSDNNLLNIYEKYLNDKIDIYVQKINNPALDKPIIEKYYKYYAVNFLLKHTNYYCLVKFDLGNALITLIATLTREGGGFLIADFNEIFLHGKIAEYYAAKWLVDVVSNNDNTYLLKGEKELCINILKSEIFKPEFSSVQLFFDLIVSKDCKLHEAILAKNFKFVKEVIQSDVEKVYEVNKYQQTLLHTIISNCNVEERSYGLNRELVEILYSLYANFAQILNSKDFLGLSPVDYANLKISKSVLKIKLIEIKVEENHYFVTYNMPFNVVEFLFSEIANNISRLHLLSVIPKIKEINFDSLISLVTGGYFSEVVDILGMPEVTRALDANANNVLHWAVENNEKFIDYLASSHYNSVLLTAKNKNNDTPLLLAVQFGRLNIFKALVAKVPKLSLNEQDVAIIYAVIGEYVDTLIFLISLNYKYQNPLPIYIAIKQKNVTILKYILMQTISPIQFRNNITYFHYASTYKNKVIIECVLKLHEYPVERLNVNIPTHYMEWLQETNGLNAQDTLGLTPLMYAAKHDNTEVVNYLVCNGADLKSTDKEGFTCVHYSVESGSVNTLQFLCQKDVDINPRTTSGYTPLHLAVINKNYKIVKFLIDKADLNCTDNSGRTILHHAARSGDGEIINLLCQNNVDVNCKDVDGWTPLHFSAQAKNVEPLKLLLSNGADYKCLNNEGQAPLFPAIFSGKLDVVECLITKGADISTIDADGNTLLHRAADQGHKNIIQYLIPFTSDINLRNNSGRTPLFQSIFSGKLDVVEFLISNGADMSTVDGKGNTLLHMAANQGHKNIIQYLLPFTTDINLKNNSGRTPLFQSIFSGKLDVVEILISNGADISTVDEDGDTLLHIAANKGHTNIIQYLIPFTTDINLKNNSGRTPLFQSIFSGKLDVGEILISNGADISTIDEAGDTLLHIAANKGHKNIIQYLIPFTTDINLRNNSGQTPLFYAIFSGKLEVVEFLISNGADISTVDADGNTLLHVAADQGHTNIIQYLIPFTSDINLRNNSGQTPLFYAIFSGKLDVVEILISNGADISTVDEVGNTLLHMAALNGHKNIILYLIPFISDINLRNNSGQTPLFLSIFSRKLDVVEILISNGADISTVDDLKNNTGKTPLHAAILGGKLDAVKCLINSGFDPKCLDEKGFSCFDYADQKQHHDIIKYFKSLSENTSENQQITHQEKTSPSKASSIHSAAIKGNLEAVKFLIQKGADAKSLDKNGLSCMDYAAAGGFIDTAQYLTQFYKNINTRNFHGATPLHYAVRANLKTVELFIRKRAEPTIPNNNGVTCLHYAAKRGDVEIIKYIIQNSNGLVNARSRFGETPLHYAIKAGKLGAVEFLISRGAELNVDNDKLNYMNYAIKAGSTDIIRKLLALPNNNNYEVTPLHLAVINGNLGIIKFLINLGAAPQSSDKNGTTTIHYASKTGDLEIIKYFLQFSSNLNVNNCFGAKPLHYAAQGRLEAVEFLIGKGADLTSLDYDESTILHYAAAAGNPGIIKFLIKQGNRVNAENYFGFTPLHIAVANGNLNAVKNLIENGANPMCVDDNGLSCLHFAAEKGFVNIIDYLTPHINNINIRSTLGTTPLHYAAGNTLEALTFLIEKQADATIVDYGGFSCVHYAAKAGNIEIIEFLFKRKIDINLKNNLGATPLHYSRNLDVLQYLIKNGADLMDTDINNSTCVHYAAKSGCVEIMKYLIAQNMDINVRNCFDLTPLHMAVENGNLNIIKCLIAQGADSNIKDIKGLNCIEYAKKLRCKDIIRYFNSK